MVKILYFKSTITFHIQYESRCFFRDTFNDLSDLIYTRTNAKQSFFQCSSTIIVSVIEINYQVLSLVDVDIRHFFLSCAFFLILQSLNHLFQVSFFSGISGPRLTLSFVVFHFTVSIH